MSVIPETVLNLLAWKEIEIRVCGNPEISIEGLKKSGKACFYILDNITQYDTIHLLTYNSKLKVFNEYVVFHTQKIQIINH